MGNPKQNLRPFEVKSVPKKLGEEFPFIEGVDIDAGNCPELAAVLKELSQELGATQRCRDEVRAVYAFGFNLFRRNYNAQEFSLIIQRMIGDPVKQQKTLKSQNFVRCAGAASCAQLRLQLDNFGKRLTCLRDCLQKTIRQLDATEYVRVLDHTRLAIQTNCLHVAELLTRYHSDKEKAEEELSSVVDLEQPNSTLVTAFAELWKPQKEHQTDMPGGANLLVYYLYSPGVLANLSVSDLDASYHRLLEALTRLRSMEFQIVNGGQLHEEQFSQRIQCCKDSAEMFRMIEKQNRLCSTYEGLTISLNLQTWLLEKAEVSLQHALKRSMAEVLQLSENDFAAAQNPDAVRVAMFNCFMAYALCIMASETRLRVREIVFKNRRTQTTQQAFATEVEKMLAVSR